MKELSSVSAVQFARLVEQVGGEREAPLPPEARAPTANGAQGAGRKHAIVVSVRLLMVLRYRRWNESYRALGGLFGVSEDSVLRSMDDLLPLVAARASPLPRTRCPHRRRSRGAVGEADQTISAGRIPRLKVHRGLHGYRLSPRRFDTVIARRRRHHHHSRLAHPTRRQTNTPRSPFRDGSS
jgi:hypothetical protein